MTIALGREPGQMGSTESFRRYVGSSSVRAAYRERSSAETAYRECAAAGPSTAVSRNATS